MKSLVIRILTVAVCASVCAVATAGIGLPTSTLTPYEIVPELSFFSANGELFEGEFAVTGQFDFEEDDFVIGGARGVRFLDAAVTGTATNGSPLDLDDFLNLEALSGNVAPRIFDPGEEFVFSGTNADGLLVDLDGAYLGNWIYLWGGATPVDDQDGIPDYRLGLVAAIHPFADENRDLLVTAADYTARRDTGEDTAPWREQFGALGPDPILLNFVGNQTPLATTATFAVPEPASVVLLGLAGLLTVAVRRPR